MQTPSPANPRAFFILHAGNVLQPIGSTVKVYTATHLTCAEKFDEGVCVVCTGAVTAWWVSICNWTRYFFTEARVTASLLRISLLCVLRELVSFVGPAFG
ncbi:hypothetical protein JG687_00010743 [Phytophthora cactorum]|uniref:Uncharacterized protein n=1 Tax=Phytophthora cactorum TaxID=29920 RepID=A0A8T1U8P3_9STRA|nr:hypothetical protein JG687_00010743 [Phytophthora cactorum]